MSVDVLDLLLSDIPGGGHYRPPATTQAIRKINYSHDAMIDLIIADPGVHQNHLALAFGYSAAWVSRVMSSDAFQARLAERTSELVDPTIRQTVEERFKSLVIRSMEILAIKLNRPPEEIPDNLALRTLELSSRALGYGAKEPPAPHVQVNMNVHLEEMGENLTKLLTRRKAELVQGEFVANDEKGG